MGGSGYGTKNEISCIRDTLLEKYSEYMSAVIIGVLYTDLAFNLYVFPTCCMCKLESTSSQIV